MAGDGGGQVAQADLEAKTGQVSNRFASAAPEEGNSRKLVGRWLGVGIVATTAVLGLIVLYKTTHHPRTDDATVLANYIGIAPQVEGPLVRLPIQDNQFVRKGELLFEIDDRAYQYALEKALSE
ncbi:MAG TPA: biotin/lipoyl-binding protein, partial [Candidatus Saccharimonadales bacterium]|nr:biotin/lipoyl-binding protein [Candidatus Saccharimonadales bacterium]